MMNSAFVRLLCAALLAGAPLAAQGPPPAPPAKPAAKPPAAPAATPSATPTAAPAATPAATPRSKKSDPKKSGDQRKTRGEILAQAKAQKAPPPTLAERYLSSWRQLFPTMAAAAGDFSQAANLEDLPPQRLRSWLQYNKNLAREIDSRLANPEIQGDERLDLYVLRGQVRLETVNYEILRRPQLDPLYWTDLFSQATVFQLVREDRPAAERLEAAARRADKMGILAGQTIASLGAGDPAEISGEHVDSAIGVLRPLAQFYREGFAQAAAQLPAGPQRDRLATRLAGAGGKAAAAIEALIPFLERLRPRAKGDGRLGAKYQALFRAATGLDEPTAAVIERATRALDAKRREAAEHCRAIWPQYLAATPQPEDEKEMLRTCFARVEQDSAKTTAEFLADFRKLTADAQAFVRKKGFMTLPPRLQVRIEESPAYFGAAAVGGLYPPGPFAPDAPSLLFVPTPPPGVSPEDMAAFFRDFNHPFNVMITPHETVPGHAAQMTVAAHLPFKVRMLFANGPYTEGWGTFSERLMLDQGWGDGLARLAHLKKQLENVARVIVDISVHTKGWTREQATAFVRDEALQKEQFAGNMWSRTLRTPTQITTYWIGYQQIQELYQEAREKQGKSFVLRRFVDDMMKLGPVPISFYRQVIFPPPPAAPPATPTATPAATPTAAPAGPKAGSSGG